MMTEFEAGRLTSSVESLTEQVKEMKIKIEQFITGTIPRREFEDLKSEVEDLQVDVENLKTASAQNAWMPKLLLAGITSAATAIVTGLVAHFL